MHSHTSRRTQAFFFSNLATYGVFFLAITLRPRIYQPSQRNSDTALLHLTTSISSARLNYQPGITIALEIRGTRQYYLRDPGSTAFPARWAHFGKLKSWHGGTQTINKGWLGLVLSLMTPKFFKASSKVKLATGRCHHFIILSLKAYPRWAQGICGKIWRKKNTLRNAEKSRHRKMHKHLLRKVECDKDFNLSSI